MAWEASALPREYGKNWFSMWTDEHFCTGRLFDKLFYQVLIGQSGTNDAGICPINFRKWRKALRDGFCMPTEADVKASLVRQERRGYVFTDEDTGEILIRAHIRRDQVWRQPAVMVSALRDLAACQSPKFAAVMLAELDRIELPAVNTGSKQGERLADSLKRTSEAARLRLEALSEGLPEPLPEPFTEDFPEGLPEPFPRPAETEPFHRPFQEGLQEPPVVVEVEVVNSPPVVGYVGKVAPTQPEIGQTAATPNRNEPPTPRCPDHINDEHPPPCGACGGYRRARERWDQRQAAAAAEARSAEIRAAAEIREAAIAACTICDPDGRLPSGTVCNHDPNQADTNRRGIAAVRAALTKPCTDAAAGAAEGDQ